VTVTAFDQYGNIATGYTGTVHFGSSDGQAVLPDQITHLSELTLGYMNSPTASSSKRSAAAARRLPSAIG